MLAILLADEADHKLTNKAIVSHHRIEIYLLCHFDRRVSQFIDQFIVTKGDKPLIASAAEP